MAKGQRGYTLAGRKLARWFEASGRTKASVGRYCGRDGRWFSDVMKGDVRVDQEKLVLLSEITGIAGDSLLRPSREEQDKMNREWLNDRQDAAGQAAQARSMGLEKAECASCKGRGWTWRKKDA
jgi:hypothetical protein